MRSVALRRGELLLWVFPAPSGRFADAQEFRCPILPGACPVCLARAIVKLPPPVLVGQPVDTTHVCHPSIGGCNQGFVLEEEEGEGVLKKKIDRSTKRITVAVPVVDEATTGDVIACGFRQNMLEMGDKKEPDHGGLDTGTGLGSDAIVMTWKGRSAILRGRDLFKAWVATFDPDSAARMP